MVDFRAVKTPFFGMLVSTMPYRRRIIFSLSDILLSLFPFQQRVVRPDYSHKLFADSRCQYIFLVMTLAVDAAG